MPSSLARLSPAKHNYDVGNRELLAVKLALAEWRHWLEGAELPFVVWMDHKNLRVPPVHQTFKIPVRLDGCCSSVDLSSLTRRPGSRNVKPDALFPQFSLDDQLEEPETILPWNCIVASLT